MCPLALWCLIPGLIISGTQWCLNEYDPHNDASINMDTTGRRYGISATMATNAEDDNASINMVAIGSEMVPQ